MEWTMPDWMIPFAGTYIPDKETCEQHMNAGEEVNIVTNAPLAMMVIATKERVALLNALQRDYCLLNPIASKK